MDTPATGLTGLTLKDLLDAGLHFGHQTKRWNPKMKRYIFDKRSGIHIIDLTKTVDYKAVYELARRIEMSRNYLLLEALAHDTAQAILEEFPVDEVVIRARKQSVPLGGLIDFSEVEIRRARAAS